MVLPTSISESSVDVAMSMMSMSSARKAVVICGGTITRKIAMAVISHSSDVRCDGTGTGTGRWKVH